MSPVYRVKTYPVLLISVGTLVMGILFVYFTYWATAPNWPHALNWWGWLLLICGFFGIIGGFAGIIGSRKVVGVKEIEVGPKGIILRHRDGKEIACRKIDKITVGVFQRGRVWGRYTKAGPRWIEITGQTQDGKPWRTAINKGGPNLGWKELASLRDDLQNFFKNKIEEKKVRFA